MADSSLPTAGTTAELAFALGHEIANLVGAVRMHAHLMDSRMSPRDLARVSVGIDDLCARSAALLAHLRPLLDEPAPVSRPAAPLDVIDGLRDVMSHHGGRGTRLGFEADADLPRVEFDQEILHSLLLSLLFMGLEAAAGSGCVELAVRCRGGEVVFSVEDDGPVAEDPTAWRGQTARGRPLVCAVADVIVGKRGGSLEVGRDGGRTRVSLRVPVREAPR